MSGVALAEERVDAEPRQRPRAIVLTSSMLTDRMLQYTGVLERLNDGADIQIWAGSCRNSDGRKAWESVDAEVERFPDVAPYKEFPYAYLRRINEFAWDQRLKPPSRLSFQTHRLHERTTMTRAMRWPGRFVAYLGCEVVFETRLEKLLKRFPRSPEAEAMIQEYRPDVMLTTNPFWFTEPAVAAVASRFRIPTLAMVPSWDNVTTKNRMVFDYDGFIVWSETTKAELLEYYPSSRRVPIYVVGAPQFDVFKQTRFFEDRGHFLQRFGLSPDKLLLLYALGSPNFLREHYGALETAKAVCAGALGDVQMLVRPHPIHDKGAMSELFREFAPRVVTQQVGQTQFAVTERCQSEADIVDWVNAFRHADVVVNLASTSTIDAALFDRPVVNLDFDPHPDRTDQRMIKVINHLWTHFKPVAESGGVWLVNDFDELFAAIRGYLAKPELHREQRRWIVDHVTGYSDGRCGERMADAVLDFLAKHGNVSKHVN